MFGLSPGIAGALVGLVLGLISFVTIRMLADRLDKPGNDGTQRRTAGILRLVAVLDVFFFTAAGYLIGALAFA